CATLAEWHRMKAAQDNANRRCEVGFLLQSSSSMQFLRRKLCEGVIGKVQQVWTGVRWSRNDNYYARSSWAGHWQIDDTPVFDGPATNALAHAVQAALGLAASTPSTMPIVRQARGAIWRARPIESYDTAFLDIETTDDVAIRLVFTHATSFSDEVVMRVKGEQGTAAITWNGQVTLHPEGKEEQQFKFLQQPALSAFASFLQSIAHTEHVTQTPLEHTLPFMQAISSMSQSSSGIHNFPSQKVSRREECYQVSDLDEEIQDFQNDFDKIPKSLLLPQAKWIEPENLSPDLPPLNQTNNHGHE
ncbi:MAG: hypothetical protein ABI210_13950, partial [Abditibacteriaceae bacterium]